MHGWSRKARALTFALSVAAAASAPALSRAQDAPPGSPPPIAPITPSAEELDRASAAPARDQNGNNDLFSQEAAGPCPLRDSQLTFTLRSVEFRGATALTAEALARSYDGQLGREIPVSSICDIRDRAGELFFDEGVLARVEIPEQRISEGALVLEVIEARIASVRVRGDAGPAQAKVEGYIERLRGMAPFDLGQVQRYLLLASDVPGVRLAFAVRPSAQGRGAVDLEVTVIERDAIDVIANVQNLGAKSLGRWGGLVRADFNGYTRFGERTSLIVYSTLESDEQQVVQLIEELRLGSAGWVARGSFAYGKSKPGDLFEPLALDGDSFVSELSASYPLIRQRRRSLYATGGFEYVDQTTEFGSGGTLTDDKLRVFFGRLDGELRRFPYGQPLGLNGGLELRKGVEGLGSSEAGENTLSRTDGIPDAWVVRGYARAEQTLGRYVTARASVEAQYADEPLLAYEELAVGNLTIGRGYDPNSVSGDSGVRAAFELQVGPFRPVRQLATYALGFYDVARVDNNDQGAEPRTVDSVGGGLRVRLTDRVSFDVLYVHPFDPPIDASETRPPDRVLFNLVAQLY